MIRLAADNESRTDGESTGSARPHGGIDNPQALDAVDAELGVDAVVGIVARPHAAGRRDVVAEGVVHEGLLGVGAGRGFHDLEGGVGRAHGVEGAHGERGALGQRLQVAVVGAFPVEPVEVDARRGAGVARPQRDGPRLAADLHLHHRPEEGAVGDLLPAVPREVPPELRARRPEEEHVAVGVLADAGLKPHGERGPALPIRPHVLRLPLRDARVRFRVRRVEGAGRERVVLPGGAGADRHASFVVILHVAALGTFFY